MHSVLTELGICKRNKYVSYYVGECDKHIRLASIYDQLIALCNISKKTMSDPQYRGNISDLLRVLEGSGPQLARARRR